jgi:hypothetical protein
LSRPGERNRIGPSSNPGGNQRAFLELSPEAPACRFHHSGRGAAARRFHLYNLSGWALPDPSGTYRVEMTLPNGQVATASFGLKP